MATPHEMWDRYSKEEIFRRLVEIFSLPDQFALQFLDEITYLMNRNRELSQE